MAWTWTAFIWITVILSSLLYLYMRIKWFKNQRNTHTHILTVEACVVHLTYHIGCFFRYVWKGFLHARECTYKRHQASGYISMWSYQRSTSPACYCAGRENVLWSLSSECFAMRQLCGAHVRVNLHGLVPCHLCMFVSSYVLEWFISSILVVCAGSSFFSIFLDQVSMYFNKAFWQWNCLVVHLD